MFVKVFSGTKKVEKKMNISFGFSKFAATTAVLAVLAIGSPQQAKSAIVFANFGPETIDLNEPFYTIPDFFGGNVTFGYQQLAFPSAQRQGFFATTGNATLSLLTSGGNISILAPNTQIDGNTAGTWSNPNAFNLLFDYAVGPNTFNPNLLTSATTGIIGVRITSNSDLFYGWFEITDIDNAALGYDVQGFLYNDTPGAAVLAGSSTDPNPPPAPGAVPEPSSVGMLILGAAGVYAFRRRRDD